MASRVRTGALLAALLVCAGPSARAALEIDSQDVVFQWAPASGPVAGYFVYVSINSGPESLDHATPGTESEPIPGIPGDRIQVRVAAFDASQNVGPRSAFSEIVVLAPPPPPPGGAPPPGGSPPPPSGDPGTDRDIDKSFTGAPDTSPGSQIKLELDGANGAEGRLRFKLNDKNAWLAIKAKGLAPETDYQVRVDGTPQLLVTSDRKGKLQFQVDALGEKDGVLWFDPRGRVLTLRHAGQNVLTAVVSGPGEPLKSKVKEQTQLASEASGGSLDSRFQVSPNGRKLLQLRLKDALPGTYLVLLDGLEIGRIEANGKGKGNLKLDSKKQRGLDFDPRGGLLELVRDNELHFAGEAEAQLAGFSICDEDQTAFPLGSTGLTQGTAQATIALDASCNLTLRVTLSGLAPGRYAIFVGEDHLGWVDAPNGSGTLTAGSAPGAGVSLLGANPLDEAIQVSASGQILFVD